jgi:RHS repeat-associated protein
VAVRMGSTVYWVLVDQLQSTMVLLDGNGNKVGEKWYYPFGAERHTSGSLFTDRRFTGQRWDGTIGLYDYRARYYDPALGRFVQEDTVVPEPGDPQALNRYAYALNNPLRYTDPTGHDVMLVGGFMTNDWDNPEGWKEWIMAYKGWSEAEFYKEFYDPWSKA